MQGENNPMNRYRNLLILQAGIGPLVENKPFAHPKPKAGVFCQEDLDYLEACQNRCKAAQEARLDADAYPDIDPTPRETLSNTTRYYQIPGTSTIYGGRK
jgi:hypothetical protein